MADDGGLPASKMADDDDVEPIDQAPETRHKTSTDIINSAYPMCVQLRHIGNSNQAQFCILPRGYQLQSHKLLDLIGSWDAPNLSTLQGMGPVHASKASRRGLRLDLAARRLGPSRHTAHAARRGGRPGRDPARARQPLPAAAASGEMRRGRRGGRG